MDYTPLEHAGIAMAIQLIFGAIFGSFWLAGLAGCLIFVGREHAQAEQRCIQNFYGNKRANAPWYCGFLPKAWDTDSLLDMGVTFVCCAIIALILM